MSIHANFQKPYPLRFETKEKMRYFQKREEWKITDLLMNPMVMMMVLPLLLITVLPKMMGDPETQREMQEMQRNMANTQNQVNLQKNIFHVGKFLSYNTQVSFDSCNLWRNTIFRCQRSVRYLQISLEVVVAQRRKIKVRRNQPEFKEDDSKSMLQYICCDFCYI